MMTDFLFRQKVFLVFSFFAFAVFSTVPLFADSKENWVVAAERFSLKSTGAEEIDSVKSAMLDMIPARIVDNLSLTSYRTIPGDEELGRSLYKLKNERISLYLQLSSAIRAKDAVFLYDYPEKKRQSLLKEEDKKILEIQKKIDANIEEQKKAEQTAEKKMKLQGTKKEKSEGQKYLDLIKGFVFSEDLTFSEEPVSVYERNDSSIYTPSAYAKKSGYTSRAFEKGMMDAKINSLITGEVSVFGDYMVVSVEIFVYPGGKSIGAATEVGPLDDIDFISSSLAKQISPWVSASMPVAIKLKLEPAAALRSLRFSIDDIVYKSLQEEYVIDSGVHTLRFDAEGYRTAVTSFNFEGNTVYDIDVELQEEKEEVFFVRMKTPLIVPFFFEDGFFGDGKEPLVGDVFASGELMGNLTEENQIAKIRINDSDVLVQFVGSDGGSGFFYVPERLLAENEYLDVSVKTFDRSKNIDKRRRIMYTSYSAFVISLLGYVVTNANAQSYRAAYERDTTNIGLIKPANAWIISSNVAFGLALTSGVWWGYELFRYFRAADAVLPAKAKKERKTTASGGSGALGAESEDTVPVGDSEEAVDSDDGSDAFGDAEYDVEYIDDFDLVEELDY